MHQNTIMDAAFKQSSRVIIHDVHSGFLQFKFAENTGQIST